VTFKEVRLKPKIGGGDFDTKVRRAIEFLEEGDRIKVAVQFRGRELTHPEIGRALLERFSDKIKDHGVIERAPLLEGKSMHITVASIHKPKAHDGPAATHASGSPAPTDGPVAPSPPTIPAAPAAQAEATTTTEPATDGAEAPIVATPASPEPTTETAPAPTAPTAPTASAKPAAPKPKATRQDQASRSSRRGIAAGTDRRVSPQCPR